MSRARQSRHVGDYHDEFVLEVEKAVAAVAAAKAPDLGRHLNVLEEKVKSAFNGFETSTFTVCSRIRPVLLSDQIGSGENFVCVVPGGSSDSATGYCEPTRILVPTVGITGKAKIECVDLDFDYTFGADASDADIFARVGAPLVARCLAGQVGVIFAYGQTGSGYVSPAA